MSVWIWILGYVAIGLVYTWIALRIAEVTWEEDEMAVLGLAVLFFVLAWPFILAWSAGVGFGKWAIGKHGTDPKGSSTGEGT